MENLTHQHGGDLDAIERMYHIPKEEIWDFSGNINPYGFPDGVKDRLCQHINLVSTYPDKNYRKLKESIGQYTGADPSHVVVGNGSTELISTFIQTAGTKKTCILAPAYSEYANSVSLAGREYLYFPLLEEENFQLNLDRLLEALTPDIGLFIACNPNNPTGTAITTEQMERIAAHCKTIGAAVMVDETYIEFSDKLEDICSIPLTKQYDNLFVIRGISKFFAAPGLRLGYGISSSQAFLSALKKKQDPWSVNSLAAYAGEYLFEEKEFMEKTKVMISSQRKEALAELASWKQVRCYPSEANFLLLKLVTDHISAKEIFEILISKKMLIRDAASFAFLNEHFFRFCILLPEQNRRLLSELKQLIETKS